MCIRDSAAGAHADASRRARRLARRGSRNALFFMERVVGNYHVCEYKERLAAKERKRAKELAAAAAAATHGRPLLARKDSEMEDNPYESEEHVSAGLFTRKVLSRIDLQELAKNHHD